MIKLDELFEMWKKDCQIDENNLDGATIQNAKLHSKYLEIHSMTNCNLSVKNLSLKSCSKTNGFGIMERCPKKK